MQVWRCPADLPPLARRDLPCRNLELAPVDTLNEEEPLDLIMAGGVEITGAVSTEAAEWIAEDREEASCAECRRGLGTLDG